MGGLGLFTLIVVGYLFLRPARRVDRLGAEDADRIRDSARQARGTGLARLFHAAHGQEHHLVGHGQVLHRLPGAVRGHAGQRRPPRRPEAWPGAINAFLDEAARHAWVPAVLGCSELGAETWCREGGGGLTALELGDEAIVNVAEFTLQGRSMRNVRQMVTQGVPERLCRRDPPDRATFPRAEINRMIRQANSWRGSPTERGFSMALGRVGAPGDEDCVIATATEDGVLRAILHFVPWGTDGLSLDLMRRDRAAQPGLNDFLIVETIKTAPDLGVKRISLNFAMFRAALERGERIGAGPVLRAWRGILIFMSAVVPDRVAVQVQREVLPGVGAEVLRLHRYQGHPEDRPGRARGGGLPRLAHRRGAPDSPPGGALARAGQGPAPPPGRAPGALAPPPRR